MPAATLDLPLDRLPVEKRYRPLSRGRWWTVVLFVVAAALGMVVSGQYFMAIPPQERAASGAVALLAVGIPVLVVLVVMLVFAMISLFRMVTLTRENDEARALLASGQTRSAAEAFESLCRRARTAPLLHCLVVYNRGVSFLRLGDLDRGISLITSALHCGWLRSALLPGVYPTAVTALASAHALAGDLDRARRYQEVARAKVSQARSGSLLMADAMIAVRAGSYAHAADLIRSRWALAEGSFGAPELRLLRLIHAFALSKASAEVGETNRAVAELVDGARPAQPEDFAGLDRHWPELADFIRAQGFEPAPAASTS